MSDLPFDPRPVTKTARNERRKLLATTVNAGGLAIFALGVLTPIFNSGLNAAQAFNIAVSFAIFVVAHGFARRLLKGLED